eukprot:CAMPEP_0196780294 /NCGR_PEP_ID=MMETSP1104-20130614/7459_1 /TAXON_ID=33652 /ORGANISM="Cafeteria sp., Strain Caron Lab Isolate" /LENGTH=67 /DNA_ID=CAMNT_0042150491 /DNA_START=106 /DNA_END=309 /DNA_ORIENTATION=+
MLVQEFGASVAVSGESTPGISGFLEVQVVGGALLHSKKNGDGYVNTPAKQRRIIEGVRTAIEKAKAK